MLDSSRERIDDDHRERLESLAPAPPPRLRRLVWQARNRRLAPRHGTWP